MAGITLYTSSTPNGQKASVTLEELGLDYKVHPIDLGKGEQKEEWFLKINPNGRIPAIVDHSNNDFAVFESGAIMIYLAEKYGNGNLLPKEGNERYETLSWLMYQMGGVGPMMGQLSYFVNYASETVPYAQKRYYNETRRLLSVLETRLEGREYLVGDAYSLADIANVCWIVFAGFLGIDIDDFPSVKKWTQLCYAREATRKGMTIPKEFSAGLDPALPDQERKDKAAEVLAKLSGLHT